ncbi:hypothetical protein COL154_013972 [Colletotrichum chrysophilum]|nr:hypothetical protein COL154_013972 [Colletotrichum chrysophilum]
MPDRTTFEGYAGETASAIIQLSALVISPERARLASDAAGHAGVALAVAGAMMLMPIHRSRGQVYLPGDILSATGLDPQSFLEQGNREAVTKAVEAFADLGREHLAKARAALPLCKHLASGLAEFLMSFASLIFIVVVAAAASAAIAVRRIRGSGERGGDSGEVLLQFGEVFPGVAVRDIVRTADAKAIFLRLSDGRIGFVDVVGRRYQMMILRPSTTRVDASGGEKSLAVDLDGADNARTFVFARQEDAAEVSLWLCSALVTDESQMKENRQDLLS